MSNIVHSAPKKQPAYLKKVKTVGALAFMKALEPVSYLAQLTINSRAWALRIGEKTVEADPPQKIRVVMIAGKTAIESGGAEVQRRYYPEKYEEGKENQMVCFSDDGVVPAARSKEQQANTCKGCYWDRMGTDVNGREGKACKLYKRLVVVPITEDGTFLADEDGNIMPLQFDVPLMSLKNLTAYSDFLAGLGIETPLCVVTEMTFQKDLKYGVVEFAHVDYLDQEQYEAIVAVTEQEDVERAVELAAPTEIEVTPYKPDGEEEEEPAPKPKKKKAAPKKKKEPEPVEDDEIEDDFDDEEEESATTDDAGDDTEDDLLGDLDDWDDDID
jgi:hypothetical protein